MIPPKWRAVHIADPQTGLILCDDDGTTVAVLAKQPTFEDLLQKSNRIAASPDMEFAIMETLKWLNSIEEGPAEVKTGTRCVELMVHALARCRGISDDEARTCGKVVQFPGGQS